MLRLLQQISIKMKAHFARKCKLGTEQRNLFKINNSKKGIHLLDSKRQKNICSDKMRLEGEEYKLLNAKVDLSNVYAMISQ